MPNRLVVPLLAVLLVAGCAKSPRSVIAPASSSERLTTLGGPVFPVTFILSPRPTHQQPVDVPLTFPVAWTVGGRPRPTVSAFLTRVVVASEVDPANPGGATILQVRAFLQNDLMNNRAAWATVKDSTTTLRDQEPTVAKYLAIVALDGAGGIVPADTAFSLDSNVLWYRATVENLGPRLTIQSPLFYVVKATPSLDASPRTEVTIRAGSTLASTWSGVAVVGHVTTGYRWALDIGSIADESPRKNAKDLAHWSDWSLTTTGATVGPFPAGDANKPPHVLYVEARDDFGYLNLLTVAIRVSGKPRPQADLLLVDDMYGTTTSFDEAGHPQFRGPYPMEAEQDSFYNAVGGVPNLLTGGTSQAGAFAGFPYDTLDYRFWPEGIDVATLSRYKAVAWYSDIASAFRFGGKFSIAPATALRFINTVQQANTLAQYVAAGGKLFLFGEGATAAIANGYWSRIGGNTAPLPYDSGDERTDILKPGNFLYDFIHLRSQLNTAGTSNVQFTLAQQLHGCIPYLPRFAGPASQADRSHDPRIGPSSARTAVHWDDLPRLTLANYRGANADPALRSLALTFTISQPLAITEGSGRGAESTVDTLYLCQARGYDPEHVNIPPSDGNPNAIWYHGSDNGQVVWFGFPLYYFELDQARHVVRSVMRNFGINPLPAGVKEGPGAAEPPAGAESEPVPVAQGVR